MHLAERQVPPLTVLKPGTDYGPTNPAGDPARPKPLKSDARSREGVQAAPARTPGGPARCAATAAHGTVSRACFAGVDGAGKGETVNLLNAWMDLGAGLRRGRWLSRTEERERPSNGDSGVSRQGPPRLFPELVVFAPGGLLTAPTAAYRGSSSTSGCGGSPSSTRCSPTMRIGEVLDAPRQRGRPARAAEDARKRPADPWRVTKLQWKHWKMYDRFIDAAV